MYHFQRYQQTALYVSTEEGEGLNFFGYYLTAAADLPESISYDAAWSDFPGLFVFMKNVLAEQDMLVLIASLQKSFPQGSIEQTSLVWATLSSSPAAASFQLLALKKSASHSVVVAVHFSIEILGASFLLAAVSPVAPALSATGSFWGLTVTYPATPETSAPVANKNVFIPMTTAFRGCIQADIAEHADAQPEAVVPQRGFYSFVSSPETPDIYQTCFYPLFATPEQDDTPTIYTGFHMSYDPVDPYNPKRTRFTYAGFSYQIKKIAEPPYNQLEIVSGNALAKSTNYASVFGAAIKLLPLTNTDHPASFVLCELPPGYDFPYYMAPDGDFQVVTETTILNMGGGLSGTEFFKLDHSNQHNQSIIRFEAGQPACVKGFPFAMASPVAAPSDSLASPFSADYLTSWATIFTASGVALPYVAQPVGASLYAKGTAGISTGILHPTDIAFSFRSDKEKFFPLFPYSGITTGTQPHDMGLADITALEEVVLSPQRRQVITQQSTTNAHLLKNTPVETEIRYATTPGGILAQTTQNADGSAVQWDQLLLGKNGDDEMAFNSPSEQLITAMQSSDVFLVVSNATYLSGFANEVTIGDWQLSVNIGTHQTYGDYRNLMIFKGRKGKLYDPGNVANSLIANPKKWSQRKDFSIPQTDSNPDPAQLVILSNWLQTYFKDACEQTSGYFEKFKTIATSETWTGILFLRVDITGIPKNLSGIVAGVSNPSEFNAHHLGIEVSPVELNNSGIPELNKPSSFFGLIYYVDPEFTDTIPVHSIQPASNGDYDFRLLTLKVLFENTVVKGFESYAQLTLNSLFGSQVTGTYDTENIYRNVLFTGSLQINQGQPVYGLVNSNDDAFYLDSNIINKVEITSAVLSSSTTANATQQESWFALNGFIDFKLFKKPDGQRFDLFSFGNEDGKDLLRKGLNFSNAGILMTFQRGAPQNNTLSFFAGETRFNPDPNVSSLRQGSIYTQLQLGLENLVIGPAGKTPRDSGYLSVISDMALSGPGNEGWYGLRYKLNLGSPGALAGNTGFNAYLLICWSPLSKGEQHYRAGVEIALPGSGGGKSFSLQTVLTLSIDQIRLTQAGDEGSKVFMLMFTQIALKFLGLLKLPPGGNTLFYLFGNPQATDNKGALGWYAMFRQ